MRPIAPWRKRYFPRGAKNNCAVGKWPLGGDFEGGDQCRISAAGSRRCSRDRSLSLAAPKQIAQRLFRFADLLVGLRPVAQNASESALDVAFLELPRGLLGLR